MKVIICFVIKIYILFQTNFVSHGKITKERDLNVYLRLIKDKFYECIYKKK